MKQLFITAICLITASRLASQSFSQEMPIEGITKDSLYKIPLNPEYKQ